MKRMAWEGVVRQVVWVAVDEIGMAAMEGSHWALNESIKCYGSATQELVSRTRVSMRKKKKKSKGRASIFLIHNL